jgi:hypothetical protein
VTHDAKDKTDTAATPSIVMLHLRIVKIPHHQNHCESVTITESPHLRKKNAPSQVRRVEISEDQNQINMKIQEINKIKKPSQPGYPPQFAMLLPSFEPKARSIH